MKELTLRFRNNIYYELNNKTMNLQIVNVIRKITDRTKKIKGILKEDDFSFYVSVNDKSYELNFKTLQLKQGTGYCLHQGKYCKFIGEKGVTYNNKSLIKYKPGDTVKGVIINEIFNIK